MGQRFPAAPILIRVCLCSFSTIFLSLLLFFNFHYLYLAPLTVNLLGSVHLVSANLHKVAFAFFEFLDSADILCRIVGVHCSFLLSEVDACGISDLISISTGNLFELHLHFLPLRFSAFDGCFGRSGNVLGLRLGGLWLLVDGVSGPPGLDMSGVVDDVVIGGKVEGVVFGSHCFLDFII